MKIIPATIYHAKDMQRVHTAAVRKTCSKAYTAEEIEAWLKGRSPEGYHDGIKNGEMFVAEDDGEIVGFGHAIPGEVLALFVDPNSQKKGIGDMILSYAIKVASEGHDKIKVDSTVNAQSFYEKHGFRKIKDGIHERNGVKMRKIIMGKSC